MVKRELQETFREITMLGFGVIFLCHSKEYNTEFKGPDGQPLEGHKPDLPNNVYTIVNAIVDIIGYIDVQWDENGQSHRYLYTRQTPTIFAGSRYKYIEPKIDFGYNELVNAIGDAIDKEVQLDNAEVSDHTEVTVSQTVRPFSEVLEEAKECGREYLDKAASDEEREHRFLIMKEIIRKIFGNENFKLSQATPGQQDLVELFINQIKDL